MSEPLIPRPELKDTLQFPGGAEFDLSRETTTIVLHRNNYERMDHIHLKMGKKAVLLFGIHSSPLGQFAMDRGYDILVKQYPSDETVELYTEMEITKMNQELDKDLGHELDD